MIDDFRTSLGFELFPTDFRKMSTLNALKSFNDKVLSIDPWFVFCLCLSGPESMETVVVQDTSLNVFDSWDGVGLCPLNKNTNISHYIF